MPKVENLSILYSMKQSALQSQMRASMVKHFFSTFFLPQFWFFWVYWANRCFQLLPRKAGRASLEVRRCKHHPAKSTWTGYPSTMSKLRATRQGLLLDYAADKAPNQKNKNLFKKNESTENKFLISIFLLCSSLFSFCWFWITFVF